MSAVFEPGDLVRLEAAVENAKELAIQAERNAEVLRRLATDLSNCLKRADALQHPRPQPTQPPTKDIALGRGPQDILEIINSRGGALSRDILAREMNYSASTLRTYIAVLKNTGYLTENFRLLILTNKRPPLGFARA